MAAAISRLETLALAAAVSSYEAQNVARAALTSEQVAKLKEHRASQFAAWRAWGVKAAFIGLDMRPKTTKEPHHE
jgi:Spy/CpxP family protein refolding chaperone